MEIEEELPTCRCTGSPSCAERNDDLLDINGTLVDHEGAERTAALYFQSEVISPLLIEPPLVLWVAVLATIILFWRVRRSFGLLLLPYLVWITFAGALNLAIWHLNP